MSDNNRLDARYLVRTAVYDKISESCTEIILTASDKQTLLLRASEGLAKMLSAQEATEPWLKIIPIV
nr:MAG TPA: hypothetical protein [Bacteriophage sp.]